MDYKKLSLIFTLITLIPGFSVFFRRLHDVNRSSWWFAANILLVILIASIVPIFSAKKTPGILLLLISAIWLVIILYFTIKKGDPEENDYGEPFDYDGYIASLKPVRSNFDINDKSDNNTV